MSDEWPAYRCCGRKSLHSLGCVNHPRIAVGDTVKLGPKAREKHYVLDPPQGDYVRVRQWTTGKVRTVRKDRCVVISRA